MNRIIRRLKQLSSRILQEGFRRSAQPYRPDLSDGQFFDSLCDVPGDLRNAKSAYDTGDKVLAQQLVVFSGSLLALSAASGKPPESAEQYSLLAIKGLIAKTMAGRA